VKSSQREDDWANDAARLQWKEGENDKILGTRAGGLRECLGQVRSLHHSISEFSPLKHLRVLRARLFLPPRSGLVPYTIST
jgi:hypothetical protein